MSQAHGDFVLIAFNGHLFEGFGMSETAAHGTVQSIHTMNFGYIGEGIEGNTKHKLKSIPEMDYKITDEKVVELNGRQFKVNCPRGELLLKGPSVFSGYWKDEAKTKESFVDGWFTTGDVGEYDPVTKQLKLIDRKRGIFKLSQGEFISIN